MSDDLDRHQLGPLLERVNAGDRSALNELFARLRPYLHALVRKTLGPEWKDTSNIVQSSLRRINENFEDLLADDPTVPHLLAWIKKIVRNRAIDEARKRAGAPANNDSALGQVPLPVSPDAAAERDRRALSVMSALKQLPERQRQGIGSRLVRRGLDVLRERGCPFVVVVGHPEYYPRFGFEPASLHGLASQWPGVPDAVRYGDWSFET